MQSHFGIGSMNYEKWNAMKKIWEDLEKTNY